jgi:hypothetical protein
MNPGKLEFQTNVPVELALRYTQGKPVESKFGGEQKMFSSDRGVFYVAGIVGTVIENQLEDLKIQAGEKIEICKREVPQASGRKSIRWQVVRVEEQQKPKVVQMGEQPDGTFAVPKESHLERQLKASIEHVEAQKTNGAAKPIPSAAPSWAQFLLTQANALVDTYAQALKHASDEHGNAVKAESVQALLITAFINQSKNGAGYGDR